MSVIAGIAKLRDSSKKLHQQWLAVQDSWRDENARRFHENHLEPLLAQVKIVEMAMAHLAASVHKARRDCE